MFKGDMQTIAENGVCQEELTAAVREMAKEELGARDALWSVINRDRKRMIRLVQAIASVALAALIITLAQLFFLLK